MKIILVNLFIAGIIGCGVIPGDMTESRKAKESGWSKNAIYKTIAPTFLIDDKNNQRYYISRSNAKHLSEKIGHQCGSTILPRSINEYKNHPENWSHIIALLPTNTQIRFDQAFNSGGLDVGLNSLSIEATVLGERQVKVNLNCISLANFETQFFTRDILWLQD